MKEEVSARSLEDFSLWLDPVDFPKGRKSEGNDTAHVWMGIKNYGQV